MDYQEMYLELFRAQTETVDRLEGLIKDLEALISEIQRAWATAEAPVAKGEGEGP